MHITPRIEKVLIKSKSVLKCWEHWLSDGLVEKIGIKCFFLNVALWDFTQ